MAIRKRSLKNTPLVGEKESTPPVYRKPNIKTRIDRKNEAKEKELKEKEARKEARIAKKLKKKEKKPKRTKEQEAERVAKRVAKVTVGVNARKELFLDTYERLNCNIGATCKALSMTRRAFNKWKQHDDEFKEGCREAEQNYIDTLIALHDKFCLEKKDAKQLWKKIQAKTDDEDYRRASKQELSGVNGTPLLAGIKDEFSDEALKNAVKNILLEEEGGE